MAWSRAGRTGPSTTGGMADHGAGGAEPGVRLGHLLNIGYTKNDMVQSDYVTDYLTIHMNK